MRAFVYHDGQVSWGKPNAFGEVQPSCGQDKYNDYLVVNAGVVAVDFSNRAVRVRWRPRVVSDAAFAGTLYLLADCNPDRVYVERHDGRMWHSALVSGEISIVSNYLESQLYLDRPTEVTPSVLTERVDLDNLDDSDPLRLLVKYWRNADSRKFENGVATVGKIADTELNSRYVWMRAQLGSVIAIDRIGAGFNRHVREVLLPAVGQPIDCIPDHGFGRYCLDAYARVACQQAPLLHKVDAVIRHPTGITIRRTYRRLILPFTGLNEAQLLFGCSLEDPSINLRRTAA